ncbi:DUF805 domain-containing protein [Pokkaliibacter sp. CJK22405]|uniref:DUF805 domain-containing protein n=1 Tax=Pokkaliibacter sp. CJK22405 TaxID=3384615 RepID=UPI00398505A0
MRYYLLSWQRGLDFDGRLSRKAFWYYMLVHVLITLGTITADIAWSTWFDPLYSLASFIPMLSAIFRRLHDAGKSGYWSLVFLIPAIGPLILIYLLTLSTDEANKQGVFA